MTVNEALRAIMDQHRDADGKALLVGPDCPDCERRAEVVYGCTVCDYRVAVTGTYTWSWQGKGHWHRADDETVFDETITTHLQFHKKGAMFLPEAMSDRWGE